MSNDQHRTIAFTADLHSEDALCTLEEALTRPDITGSFADYLYCVENGRQVLLGHGGSPLPMGPRSMATPVQSVFVTQGLHHFRNPTNWEELREHLAQGWIIGTVKQPGVKIWFMDNGRNNRRTPERIFVFHNTQERGDS